MEAADESAGRAAILLTFAKIHQEEGRGEEARAYAKRCLDVARESGVAFVVDDAEQILAGENEKN